MAMEGRLEKVIFDEMGQTQIWLVKLPNSLSLHISLPKHAQIQNSKIFNVEIETARTRSSIIHDRSRSVKMVCKNALFIY